MVLVLALLAVAAGGFGSVFGRDLPPIRPDTVVGDRVCELCHAGKGEEIAGSIHGALTEGPHPVTCEGCHGAGGAHILSAYEDEGPPRHMQDLTELDPTSLSKRCLACHLRTAKNNHVRGFLGSKLLASGKSCADCHRPHAPRPSEKAPAAAAPKPKAIGTQACLLCHKDRPEMTDFPHRKRVEDMLGCEACHGPGRTHAESRGAAGTIRNPGKMKPGKSDMACLLCHSDKMAGHFEPAPGKERCADCHTIHPPPAAPAPTPRPTPGRPVFRIDAGTAVAEPAPVRAFAMPSIPPSREGSLDLMGFQIGGSARFGGRYTSVNGSERIYDRDRGYDSGPRLFDLELSAVAGEGPVTRVFVSATGIDDPVERYRLDVRGGDEWAFSAKAKRENLVYRATADPRDLSARREELDLSATLFPSDLVRLTVGVDLDRRDGRSRGSRLIPGGISPSVEPFEETGTRVFARIDYSKGPFSLSVSPSYRWEDLEDGLRTAPPAGAPNPHLDYRADTEVHVPMLTAVGKYEVADDLTLDGSLVLGRVDSQTDTKSRTTGPGSGAGSVERTTGDVSGIRDIFRVELGAVWFPLPELSVGARVESRLEDSDSGGDFVTRASDPPGSAPAATVEREDYEREQRRLRAALEGEWRPLDLAAVRAGYEWVFDDFDRTENGRSRDHDARIDGPYAGLDLDPTDDLEVNLLYRFVRVDDPFTEIATQDEDQAKLRVRYRARENLRVNAFLLRSLATNQRRDTDVLAWSTGFGLLWDPIEDLTVEAGADYQAFSTETDAVRFFGGTPVYGRSEFTGRTRGGRLSAAYAIAPDLRLRGAASLYDTTGDFATRLLDLSLGIEAEIGHVLSDLGALTWGPYGLRRDYVVVGSDFRYTSYDERGARADDFDAYTLELWLRVRF